MVSKRASVAGHQPCQSARFSFQSESVRQHSLASSAVCLIAPAGAVRAGLIQLLRPGLSLMLSLASPVTTCYGRGSPAASRLIVADAGACCVVKFRAWQGSCKNVRNSQQQRTPLPLWRCRCRLSPAALPQIPANWAANSLRRDGDICLQRAEHNRMAFSTTSDEVVHRFAHQVTEEQGSGFMRATR